MAIAEINGVRIAWQQMGEGPDLVLVHGLATNRAFWFGIASALAGRYRVTLYDLRGHGYSEMPASGYSARDLGADLLALMDVVEIPQAAVIGHSYGGGAALEAAVMSPERVSRLALLDTRVQRLQPQMYLHDLPDLSAYEIGIAEASRKAYGYDWENDPQVGFRFLEATARLRVEGLDGELRDSFTPFGEGRGAARTAKHWLRLLDETAARSEFIDPGADAGQIAAALQCTPTLLMYASGSRCQPSGSQLHALLPHAQFHTVDGGHFFPVSRLAPTLAVLQDFLAPHA